MMKTMKTMKGYKLFEQDKDGQNHPLFIGKKGITPVGVWVPAEYIPTDGFAARGGWHIGQLPSAVWLMDHNGVYKSQRGKTFRRVWYEVEYNCSIDYNDYVQTLPKKCITDGCPENGYYFFREVNRGIWIITSDIKLVHELTEEERLGVLREMGFDEGLAFEPYRQAMLKAMNTRAMAMGVA